MKSTATKVLVVDDEQDVLEFVSYNLQKEGFDVSTASDGQTGIETAIKENPDLILLDVMMPNMDGMEVCEQLRELPQFKNTLIAFLTARNEDYSQIAGFDAGADEYLAKPIRPKLLVARLNALLKRKQSPDSTDALENWGCISVDREKHLVYRDDKAIELPKKEYDLLLLLGSKLGKVFTREHIYEQLWGHDLHVGERTIDVHVRKLREKIGTECIKTLKGVGYKFNEECG